MVAGTASRLKAMVACSKAWKQACCTSDYTIDAFNIWSFCPELCTGREAHGGGTTDREVRQSLLEPRGTLRLLCDECYRVSDRIDRGSGVSCDLYGRSKPSRGDPELLFRVCFRNEALYVTRQCYIC